MVPANSIYIKRPELLSMKLAVNSRSINIFVMKWGGFNYCLNLMMNVRGTSSTASQASDRPAPGRR